MSPFSNGHSAEWRNVTASAPCPKCQKPDYCSVSGDGNWCICRRTSEGAHSEKQDSAGATYYTHRLTPWPERESEWPAPIYSLADGKGKRADADTRYRVYKALVSHLPLSVPDARSLEARGLDVKELKPKGYRTLGMGRGKATYELIKLGLEKHLPTVPGFFVAERNGKKYWTVAGASGIVVPVRDTRGRITCLLIRREADVKEAKYVWLTSKSKGRGGPGARASVHVPLFKGDKTLVRVTEGALKADIATKFSGILTLGLPGVGSWKKAARILKRLGVKTVRVAFDADCRRNRNVAGHLERLVRHLRAKGFTVELETWDEADGKGIDDLLRAGKTPMVLSGEAIDPALRDIVEAASKASSATAHSANAVGDDKPNDGSPKASEPIPTGNVYGVRGGAMCVRTWVNNKEEYRPLCNFTARIVEERTRDDGVEQFKFFVVAGALGSGQALPEVEVTAATFDGMGWVSEAWGSAPIIEVGKSYRDHLRAAILWQSIGHVKRRTVYAHLGWRQVGDDWIYLHAGGAIGADGSLVTVETALPDPLAKFVLPPPPEGKALVVAVRASLGILKDLAPDRIAFPAFLVPYRAVMGDCDFSVHMAGATGLFKTELATLGQQHHGSELDARSLPASWTSTANSLEGLAFAAKDALLVVDDFAPGGSTHDVQRVHREADRLLRAQGNKSGRGRMRMDGTLRPARPPRGLILSTGEDVPRGQSLRSRLHVTEVSKGDVDTGRLTECQRDAANGLYAQSLAAFVRWLAPRYGEVRSRLRTEQTELRNQASKKDQHARTSGIVAALALGLRYVLDFAQSVGAVSSEEYQGLWGRGWKALEETAAEQAVHGADAEPAGQFLRLLSSALSSGRAHLAGKHGGPPCEARAWGWRIFEKTDGGDGDAMPLGKLVGWLDGGQICLDPEASFAEVQRLAVEQGESLPVTKLTLWRRLRERGHLIPDSRSGKTRFTFRRMLGGRSRDVVCLPQTVFAPPAEKSEPMDTPSAKSAQMDTPECPLDTPKKGECPSNNTDSATGYGMNGHFGHFKEKNREETIHARTENSGEGWSEEV